MGFLDSPILPKNSDPSLERYMQQQRKQQFWNMLMQAGQGIMAANRQGQSPLRAVSAGLAQGRPTGDQGLGGLLDWMKVRGYEQKQQDREQEKEREQRQYDARDMLSSRTLASARHPAPAGLLAGRSLLDREYGGLLGQGYSEAVGKAKVAQAFPKEPKYGTPVTVQGPNGPELVRFPQGAGDPVSVQGYSPYTKPGEGPALVQIANAYRSAMGQARTPVSELKALQWAKTSVGRNDKDNWISIHNAGLRGFMSPEEARSLADETMRHVTAFRTGNTQQPSAAGLSPVSPAGAAMPPGRAGGLLASVSPIKTGLGPGEQPPYPRRKPSMEGVPLPLPAAGLGTGTAGMIPGRPPLDALSPAQKLERLSEQRPGKLSEPSPVPRRKPAREIDSPKRPLPKTAAGKVDAKRLVSGQVYEASDLTLWLWNGRNFKQVAD